MYGHHDQLEFVASRYLPAIYGQTQADEVEYAALHKRIGILQAWAYAVYHELNGVADQVELIVDVVRGRIVAGAQLSGRNGGGQRLSRHTINDQTKKHVNLFLSTEKHKMEDIWNSRVRIGWKTKNYIKTSTEKYLIFNKK